MDHSLFELLGTEGQLGCFQFEAMVNKASYAGFGANMSFDFSGLNAQKCDRWVIWYV